ncbi:MAG: DUF5060 domain-containing protein [Planctomycetota bacterium]
MRKSTSCLCAGLVMLFLAIGVTQAKATTISNISQNGSTIGRFEKFELTFTVSEAYSNPFDTDIVDIRAVFTQPDGNTVDVPAFFYKEYDEDATGHYVNERNPCWKVRFAPSQLGTYEISQITIIDDNGTNVIDPSVTFTCIDSAKKGIIKVDSRDPHYMRYDTNETYKPIGHNVCWLNENGTSQWESYFTKMANTGENWTRIWMTHFNQGTVLEWRSNHWSGYYDGVGNLSMPIAWRLDRIIESCEQHGIAIQLALQYHGQFNSGVKWHWDDNPYNIIHAATDGGFLNDPNEFFTNAEARRITKYKYRYIVARWGYSPAILAWELFNEVYATDGWHNNQTSVVDWHDEMAGYIKSVDPFKHLVTTSADTPGFENIWSLGNIDVIQVHYYGPETVSSFKNAANRLSGYEKPIIMGEFGAGDTQGVHVPEASPNDMPEPYRTQLYEALMLHNGIWSSFHLGSSAHLWWWDEYIDPLDLYDEFSALSSYAQGENPAAYNLSKADINTSGLPSWAFAFPGLLDFWSVSTQAVFTIQPDGTVPGIENLSRFLQGTWKEELRSDPSFNINMGNSSVLRILVEKVSNSGNISLRVLEDGEQIFSSTYANGSTNFIIEVPITAGQHTVQIENTGQDWFKISSYEFKEDSGGEQGYLGFVGLSGDDHAYIWIYDVGSQWGRTPYGTFYDVNFILNGLSDGYYTVETYETRGNGGIVDINEAYCGNNELIIELPDFEKDIAVKVKPPCIVDLDDLATMCAQWLQPGPNLAGGSNVDLKDFSSLAGYWKGQCPDGWPF